MISSALDLPDDLEYVSDELPGLRRRKTASGFRYLDSEGNPIRNERQIERIKRLAIPPAWTDVWISPKANGHLQATGRDARGRKQYRYHARWREVRDQAKYERTQDFAAALPALRKRVERDLGTPGLTRDKVLATVVRLLDLTLVRVGNEEYARSNRSFGMTTLRKRHVQLAGGGIRIEFKGKGGKQHCVSVSDRRVARIVGRCQELPGQLLFQYLDEAGERRQVTSNDVNDYIREATAGD
ncbi:MAG TPA: DNA topoisomerase IB, partial [Dehalococcoidia bacterium]|nr:DNA topoisomerase IB [Dehalococcoidia bacterium]